MAFIFQFPLYRDFQFCTSQVHQQRGDKYRIYKRRSFYQSALLHIFWENVNTRKLQQTDQVLNLDNCKIIARSWEGDMWTGGNIHISSLKLLAEQSAPSLHHQKTTLMHSQQNWLKKGIHILLYYVYIIYQITRSRWAEDRCTRNSRFMMLLTLKRAGFIVIYILWTSF